VNAKCKENTLKHKRWLSLIVLMLLPISITSSILNYADLSQINDSKSIEIYRVIEATVIENKGSKNISLINTLGATITYPQDDIYQKLLSYKVYLNSQELKVKIREEFNGFIKTAELSDDIVLNPNASANITIVYDMIVVTNRTAPRNILRPSTPSQPIKRYKEFTKATSLWNYTNPLIMLLTDYLKSRSKNQIEYIIKSIEWISNKIVYETRIPPRHPAELLIEFRGDCDDQANLLITLLRCANIPAITEQGLVIIKGASFKGEAANGYLKYDLRNAGPHGWVKAQMPDGTWIAIDLTFAYGSKDPLDKILLAAYYTFPVIVTNRIYKEDYVTEGTTMLKDIEENKVMITYIVKVVPLKQ